MTKLLIADDEPLVQAGLKSMLNWESLGIQICGVASNGKDALALIEEHAPEIVITDIKMPIMNGLELAKECRERFGAIPIFLFLTSYEEFPLIRQAMSLQAVDYLIKLELDQESLSAAVHKALERLEQLRASQTVRSQGSALAAEYQDKFLLRLLYGLFDSGEQYQLQLRELDLKLSSPCFCAAHGEFLSEKEASMSPAQIQALYAGCVHMLSDMMNKYTGCICLSLDRTHFALILSLSEEEPERIHLLLKEAWDNSCKMIQGYFSVRIRAGVGSPVSCPLDLSLSYQEARRAFDLASGQILFWESLGQNKAHDSFNIALFKNPLTRAFEEFDDAVLDETLTQIIDLFETHPMRPLQALDGALNILYLSTSMIPQGDERIQEIFAGYPDGSRSVYRLKTSAQIGRWLRVLKDGLCRLLREERKDYKNHIVAQVQDYINSHIEEKLTLNQVASVFSLSPNYLSALFKKSSGIGFSEYITQKKIAVAKDMLLKDGLKIYEAAQALGFENAFYFSRVFKKVEGVSPREYIQLHRSGSD